jgi:hypothetical protein
VHALRTAVTTAVVGVLAGCGGPAPLTQPSPSSEPAFSPPPSSGPPNCADLRNAWVRGDAIPYQSTIRLSNGRWFAPDGHIYLQVEEACRVGLVDVQPGPVMVGSLLRQAAGYTYAYRDIVVCAVATDCTVALSLGNHEPVQSIMIADKAVIIVYLLRTGSPPTGDVNTKRTARYAWDGSRLRETSRSDVPYTTTR